MLEHLVEGFLAILIPACELMGISIVGVSALGAFGHYLSSLVTRTPYVFKFQRANCLSLSLEFKIAGRRDFENGPCPGPRRADGTWGCHHPTCAVVISDPL